MPPLGIFGRRNSASPSPPVRQTHNSTLNVSLHSSNASQRRGIFLGLGSSRHGMDGISKDEHIDRTWSRSDSGNLAMNDEKVTMEMEYLNIITDLSKEKQDARDEVTERSKETKRLSTSNRDLQSTVSDLELKLLQLSAEAAEKDQRALEDRPPATPTKGKKRLTQKGSKEANACTSEGLDRIKEQLKAHQHSNQEISSRVQKIREKYAKRRAETDEMSETSSVTSVGTMRSCTSMVPSPLSSPRHHMVEVKKLERNFEKSIIHNEELKATIIKVKEEKEETQTKFKELTKTTEEKLEENSKEVEILRSQLAGETERFEKSEQAIAELRLDKENGDSTKDNEIAHLTKKLSEQSITIAHLQNEINDKEGDVQKMKEQIKGEYEDKIKEFEEKLEEKNTEVEVLQSEIQVAKTELMEAKRENLTNVILPKNATITEEVEVAVTDVDVESQYSKVQELEAELVKLKLEIKQVEQLKIDIVVAKEELEMKDKELVTLKEENEKNKSNLSSLELDFIVVQEKNANSFQELEDLREKYDSELQKTTQLQTDEDASASAVDTAAKLAYAEKQIKELRDEMKTKLDEIKILKTNSGEEVKLQQKLDSLQLEMTSLRIELQNKKEELESINEMKNVSFNKLQTIEGDMMAIQLRSSTTFEELEDLKELYDKEKEEKTSLKDQLEKFPPQKILADAKKEHESELKRRDEEIHNVKKHLIDANMAKTEIELKLMDVMNDVVSSQSTRDLITNELEGRLDEENEHALHLKQMIEGKEDVMERMRKEFDDLRVQMEKETDTKRNEISDLNGEVVEQSSRVSSRDREFLQLKANMDDMKLQHEAEVALLKREIDEFDANEYEVQRVHHRNISLEDEVSTLRNKLGRMQMNERENSTTLLSPQSSTRVLRTRNDGLKDEVEKLQRKLRRMKRKASRVEI